MLFFLTCYNFIQKECLNMGEFTENDKLFITIKYGDLTLPENISKLPNDILKSWANSIIDFHKPNYKFAHYASQYLNDIINCDELNDIWLSSPISETIDILVRLSSILSMEKSCKSQNIEKILKFLKNNNFPYQEYETLLFKLAFEYHQKLNNVC